MSLPQELVLAGLGVVAGVLNVMAGGGSMLVMPAMVLFGLPGPVANGTNRVAILVQNISAVSGFRRQGMADFRLSLTLSLCALPGAVLGAWIGVRLEGVWFNRVLAAVMIMVMALMAGERREGSRPAARNGGPVSRGRVVAAHVLMAGVGFYGGIIQAGVGFILMAVLYRVLGLDLVRVNMHKVFIIGVYTVPALAVFAAGGHVLWRTGLILAVGNAAGAWLGSHLAVRKGERLIRGVLFAALAVMAVRLLMQAT